MNRNSQESFSQNFVPLPYRQVSVQPYAGPMTESAIVAHLMGKEAYRRTRYIVLEGESGCAIVRVEIESEKPLFSPITTVSILALPDTCTLVEDVVVDTSNPTALAAKAHSIGLGPESTLIVRGMDGHVNFIHHPDPLRIRVVDVTPPEPAKLLRMTRHVLTYAELPAVELHSESIDLRDLAAQVPDAESYLIPCRASGLDFDVPTYFLDERPERHNWTMVGCERSRQIHRHFYGYEAPYIEMCPRQLTQDNESPQLIKCCLLEENLEVTGSRAIVPWGATLKQVEKALKALVTANEQ